MANHTAEGRAPTFTIEQAGAISAMGGYITGATASTAIIGDPSSLYVCSEAALSDFTPLVTEWHDCDPATYCARCHREWRAGAAWPARRPSQTPYLARSVVDGDEEAADHNALADLLEAPLAPRR